jgi:tRNA A-37 threonylcarbamoyl transferase component Bud32
MDIPQNQVNYEKLLKERIEKTVNGHHILVRNNELHIDDKIIIIPDCKVDSIIGSGDNAVILKAIEDYTERTIAVKIWLSNASKKKSNIARSLNEIKKLSGLGFDNANVIHIYRASQVKNITYCTMEYIDGLTLHEYLKSNPSLPLNEKYDIASKIFNGLRICHEHGIFHGDLHTQNIMIDKEKKVRIIDFGTSFFSGLEKSTERDSKLMFDTILELFEKYKLQSLLVANYEKDLFKSAIATRIVLTTLVQVKTLILMSKYGLVDNLVMDIATLVASVPFFEISNIYSELFPQNTAEHSIELFNDTFSIEFFSNTPIRKNSITWKETQNQYYMNKKNFIDIAQESKSMKETVSNRVYNLLKVNPYQDEKESLYYELLMS